ncbi:hypothetical protein PHLH4_29310 [Pseudomonas sp. St316]|nr:hypothetical protein PHLH4_29310 [Pseudomonas sp. St316]
MQPWRVHVVTGEAKTHLSCAIAEVDNNPSLSNHLEDAYEYYWTCPYKTGHQLPVKLMLPPSA